MRYTFLFVLLVVVALLPQTQTTHASDWFVCPDGSHDFYWADGVVGYHPERPEDKYVVRNGYVCLFQSGNPESGRVVIWSADRLLSVPVEGVKPVDEPAFTAWASYFEMFGQGDRVRVEADSWMYLWLNPELSSVYYDEPVYGSVQYNDLGEYNYLNYDLAYIVVRLDSGGVVVANWLYTRHEKDDWVDPSYAAQFVETSSQPFNVKVGDELVVSVGVYLCYQNEVPVWSASNPYDGHAVEGEMVIVVASIWQNTYYDIAVAYGFDGENGRCYFDATLVESKNE